MASSSSPQPPTDSSGYLSPTWAVPPDWPPQSSYTSSHKPSSMSRRRSSVSSSVSSGSSASSSSSTSSWDSDYEAELEAQKQWEESLRQLNALVNLVAVPWLSRYFGRKWAYWLFERYLGIGLGKRFWLGPLSIYAPTSWR
ncbi:hypothetical protein JCM8097_009254 [Rhodosporidiobolus ruineniae]